MRKDRGFKYYLKPLSFLIFESMNVLSLKKAQVGS